MKTRASFLSFFVELSLLQLSFGENPGALVDLLHDRRLKTVGKGSGSKGKSASSSSSSSSKKKGSKSSSKENQGIPLLGEIIEESASLSTLEAFLKQAQLLDAWAQYPLDYTLLAPDNAAFEAFKAADGKLFEALMEDDGWVFHLQWILLYHVVEKKMWSDDLKDGDELTMYTTETLTVSVEEKVCFSPGLWDAGGCVVVADVMAKNGVAHLIDSVLLPYFFDYPVGKLVMDFQSMLGNTQLVRLVECVGLGGLLDTTFGITLLAPTDDALSGIDFDYYCSGMGVGDLIDILSFHVVTKVVPSVQILPGTVAHPTLYGTSISVERTEYNIMFNGASVISEDIVAYNGVIHVIDQVLMPPDYEPVMSENE